LFFKISKIVRTVAKKGVFFSHYTVHVGGRHNNGHLPPTTYHLKNKLNILEIPPTTYHHGGSGIFLGGILGSRW
jgi:hypothetical protein